MPSLPRSMTMGLQPAHALAETSAASNSPARKSRVFMNTVLGSNERCVTSGNADVAVAVGSAGFAHPEGDRAAGGGLFTAQRDRQGRDADAVGRLFGKGRPVVVAHAFLAAREVQEAGHVAQRGNGVRDGDGQLVALADEAGR